MLAQKLKMRPALAIIRHMFRWPMILPAGVPAISLYVGIWQMQLTADNLDLWLLLAAIFVFGLASWIVQANDARKAEIETKISEDRAKAQHQQIEGLGEAINRLLEFEPPGLPVAVKDLKAAQNSQIKKMVARLTAEMRVFEAGYTDREYGRWPPRPGQSKEELERAFQQMIEASSKRSREARNEFERRFRPVALALREEMRRRLGLFPPFPRSGPIDDGMLAGVYPVAEAAGQLEELARQLPG